jgi:hypothetical protein
MSRNPDQLDFFMQSTFPIRTKVTTIDVDRFRSRMKRAMSKALRECPYDRNEVAGRMAKYLDQKVSKSALDAYTAESKVNHDISLIRFKAFVHATGAVWLWDELVSDDGLTMLDGDETRLAEIAYWQQEQENIRAKLKALKAVPVRVRERAR